MSLISQDKQLNIMDNDKIFLQREYNKKNLELAKILHERLGVNSSLSEINLLDQIRIHLECIHLRRMNFKNIYNENLDIANKNKLYINGLKIIINKKSIIFDYSNPITFLKKVNSKIKSFKAPQRLMVNLKGYNLNIFNINKYETSTIELDNTIRLIINYGVTIDYIDENNEIQNFATVCFDRHSKNLIPINSKRACYADVSNFTKKYYTPIKLKDIDPSFNYYLGYAKSHIKKSCKCYTKQYIKNNRNGAGFNQDLIYMWLKKTYTKKQHYTFESTYVDLFEMYILFKRTTHLFPKGPNKQLGISNTIEIIKNIETDKLIKQYYKDWNTKFRDSSIDKNEFVKKNFHLIEKNIYVNNALFIKEIKDWFRLKLEFYNLDSTMIL